MTLDRLVLSLLLLTLGSSGTSARPFARGGAFVYDGPVRFVDASTQTSTTAIDASWSGFLFGPASYAMAVGTTPLGTEIQNFTTVPGGGSVDQFSIGSLSLSVGITYYATIQSRDAGGSPLETVSSNGIQVVAGTFVAATPLAGMAPLEVVFSGNVPGSVYYEWDFEYNETTSTFTADFSSTASPDARYVYSIPGTIQAMLLAYDSTGIPTQQSIFINVLPPSSPPPVGITATPPTQIAGQPVDFTVVVPAGVSPTGYLWDFDGDGVTDASSVASPTVTHTFGRDGAYSVRATLIDAAGAATTTTIAPAYVVTAPPGTYPVINVFTANSGSTGQIITFNADVNSGGADPLAAIHWDFDGNGEIDLITTPPSGATAWAGTVSYQYPGPGDFIAKINVVDSENLSTVGFATATIVLNPAFKRCWITQPLNNWKIWGNFVSVVAESVPAEQVVNVEFRYRAAVPPNFPPFFDPSWIPIGTAVPPPTENFGVHWDVTGLTPGASYELIARATYADFTTADSTLIQGITITVDPVTPDDEEFSGSPFTKIKTTGVNPAMTTTAGITRDMVMVLLAGSTLTYDQMRTERRSENPHPPETTLQDLKFVPGFFRKTGFKNNTSLKKPTKVTMYLNNDFGTILPDGTDLSKATLKLYRWEASRQRWEALMNQVVNPSKALVQASLLATGDLGIIAEFPRAGNGSSSSGFCGALGMEALPLILVSFLLLRRRRS